MSFTSSVDTSVYVKTARMSDKPSEFSFIFVLQKISICLTKLMFCNPLQKSVFDNIHICNMKFKHRALNFGAQGAFIRGFGTL